MTIRTVRAWPADRDWCLAPRLWREMSRQPWDVVHVQSYHTLVRAAGDAAGADASASPTSSPSTAAATPQASATAPAAPAAPAAAAAAARAPRAWSPSPASRSSEYGGELGLPPEQFALIPNGTDLAFAATGAAPQPQRRRRRSPRSAGSSATRATTA